MSSSSRPPKTSPLEFLALDGYVPVIPSLRGFNSRGDSEITITIFRSPDRTRYRVMRRYRMHDSTPGPGSPWYFSDVSPGWLARELAEYGLTLAELPQAASYEPTRVLMPSGTSIKDFALRHGFRIISDLVEGSAEQWPSHNDEPVPRTFIRLYVLGHPGTSPHWVVRQIQYETNPGVPGEWSAWEIYQHGSYALMVLEDTFGLTITGGSDLESFSEGPFAATPAEPD